MDAIMEYAIKRTHFKVRQLVGRHGFTEGDFRDLRQELLTEVLERLPKFSGHRAGAKTFVCLLIDNRIVDLIAHRNAACRDPERNECSLDDWVRDENGTWVHRDTTINEDRARVHTGQTQQDRQDVLDLAIDIEVLMNSLPQELRDLCERLKSQTVAEIMRETGMSRNRLYARIKLIRAHFTDSGLTPVEKQGTNGGAQR